MDYEFLFEGICHRVSVECGGDKVSAVVDGHALELDARYFAPHAVSLLLNGKSYVAYTAAQGKNTFVAVGKSRFCLAESGQEASRADWKPDASGETEMNIKAPMPGLVIKVNVAEGSGVNAGDSLVIVEAMKMEHELRAACHGVVAKVHVTPGQQVDAFQTLVELKPTENGSL